VKQTVACFLFDPKTDFNAHIDAPVEIIVDSQESKEKHVAHATHA